MPDFLWSIGVKSDTNVIGAILPMYMMSMDTIFPISVKVVKSKVESPVLEKVDMT